MYKLLNLYVIELEIKKSQAEGTFKLGTIGQIKNEIQSAQLSIFGMGPVQFHIVEDSPIKKDEWKLDIFIEKAVPQKALKSYLNENWTKKIVATSELLLKNNEAQDYMPIIPKDICEKIYSTLGKNKGPLKIFVKFKDEHTIEVNDKNEISVIMFIASYEREDVITLCRASFKEGLKKGIEIANSDEETLDKDIDKTCAENLWITEAFHTIL